MYACWVIQPTRQKHLDRIRASVNHLNDILEEFLSVGKLEKGKVVAHATKVDLNRLIKDTLADLQGSLLRKILVNLLFNAVKYSGAGSTINLLVS